MNRIHILACHFLIEKSKKETTKTGAIAPFTDQTTTSPLVPNSFSTPDLRDNRRIGRYFIQYIVASGYGWI